MSSDGVNGEYVKLLTAAILAFSKALTFANRDGEKPQKHQFEQQVN
jgi:hypothetical protein